MTISLSSHTSVRVGWSTKIAPAWSFDMAAIRRACHELEITEPVAVGCAEYAKGRRSGMYSLVGGEHKIRVARWLSAEEASRTLWHELTHAMQRERDPARQGTTQVRREQGHAAYHAHPAEVEARSNEGRFALTNLPRA